MTFKGEDIHLSHKTFSVTRGVVVEPRMPSSSSLDGLRCEPTSVSEVEYISFIVFHDTIFDICMN